MLIRFIGPRTQRRLWGPHVFERQNGYVQEVPAATAAEMLTHPRGDFALDEGDRLAGVVGAEAAMLLALEGIGDFEELAAVNAAEHKRLARALGVTRREFGNWMQAGMAALAVEVAEPSVWDSPNGEGLEKHG